MFKIKTAAAAVATGLIVSAVGITAPAVAHTTGIHDNCTKLNQKYPHGLGLRNAVDKTSGVPVRNFHRNSKAYRTADRHNGTLDRDNDGIACEKR